MATTHTSGLSLSLTQAASVVAELTGGHRPNPATLYRMAMAGRLEHRRFGRRVLTSREAVARLVESFNAPKPAPTAQREPRADVQQAGAEAAERIARAEA
jgi:hypothetical protein